MNWQNLTPQQQQFLMAVMGRKGGGMQMAGGVSGQPDMSQYLGDEDLARQIAAQQGVPMNVARYMLQAPSMEDSGQKYDMPRWPFSAQPAWPAQPGEAGMHRLPDPTGQPVSYLGNPLMTGGNSAVNPQQQAMMQMLMGHAQGGGMQMAGDVVPFGGGYRPLIPGNDDPYADLIRGLDGAKRMVPGTPGSVQNPGMPIAPPANSNKFSPVNFMPDQPQLGNPLMAGGNSAVNPQQQAMMQQYQAMLQQPNSFGAAANGQPALWQMLMGRSPWYGTGTAVP